MSSAPPPIASDALLATKRSRANFQPRNAYECSENMNPGLFRTTDTSASLARAPRVSLMRLPTELRQQIFRYANPVTIRMTDGMNQDHPSSERPRPIKRFMIFGAISRTFRLEMVYVLKEYLKELYHGDAEGFDGRMYLATTRLDRIGWGIVPRRLEEQVRAHYQTALNRWKIDQIERSAWMMASFQFLPKLNFEDYPDLEEVFRALKRHWAS